MVRGELAQHLGDEQRIILAPFGLTVVNPPLPGKQFLELVRNLLARKVGRVKAGDLKRLPSRRALAQPPEVRVWIVRVSNGQNAALVTRGNRLYRCPEPRRDAT